MLTVLHLVSLWLVALLFGGMVLYAFGFAAFLFSALPAALAGATAQFKRLQGLSVLVTLLHIALSAWVLARMA